MTSVASAARRPEPGFLLLVDRDVDTLKMYSEYLKLAAYETDVATDGREALAKAIARRPNAIITETRLPGIDGYELVTLLRTDASTRGIPIIVVTGDAFPSEVRRAESAGADVVLVKPCLPDRLLKEVGTLLSQPSGLRQRASEIRRRVRPQIDRSEEAPALSRERSRKLVLSRAYNRHTTTTPPAAPPSLICPNCDQTLIYLHSHLGGVSERHPEQWDYFECSEGCGQFQYRQRTRRLRKVS
jgi:CheY-like chemotaxis protein